MTGSMIAPGAGKRIITPTQEVTFKTTAADGCAFSTFEVVVPPGFDVGAHVHAHAQEFFYILEGEMDLLAFEPIERSSEGWDSWESSDGDRVFRGTAGAAMFVPSGCPHAFKNSTRRPATMLFQSFPSPDHENYFDEIAELFADGDPDKQAVQALRNRYDITQITPLRFEPPGNSELGRA